MAKNDRKNTASPGGTTSDVALTSDAMPMNIVTDAIFKRMPRKGRMGRLMNRQIHVAPCAPAAQDPKLPKTPATWAYHLKQMPTQRGGHATAHVTSGPKRK